jgi:hypothetical protein
VSEVSLPPQAGDPGADEENSDSFYILSGQEILDSTVDHPGKEWCADD